MIPAPGRDAAAAAVGWNIDKKGKTCWTETYEWTIQDLSSNSETKQGKQDVKCSMWRCDNKQPTVWSDSKTIFISLFFTTRKQQNK